MFISKWKREYCNEHGNPHRQPLPVLPNWLKYPTYWITFIYLIYRETFVNRSFIYFIIHSFNFIHSISSTQIQIILFDRPASYKYNEFLTFFFRIYDPIPARYSSDNYIHKMLVSSPVNSKVSYTTYYSEPIRKYIGKSVNDCLIY